MRIAVSRHFPPFPLTNLKDFCIFRWLPTSAPNDFGYIFSLYIADINPQNVLLKFSLQSQIKWTWKATFAIFFAAWTSRDLSKLLSTSSNLLTVASRRNSSRLIPYWESCSRSKSILMLMWAAVYSRNMSRFLQVAKSVYIAFLEHRERCQMRKIHLTFWKII